MKVEEIMSQPAVICRTTDSLNRAAHLMWENDVGVIPAVGDDGKIAGVITDRDICMAAYTQGVPLRAIRVADAMARRVYACRAEDTLEGAEKLMSEKQVRRIPVIDGSERPIGMISLNDIARHAASSSKPGGREQLTQTLAAVGRPRKPQPQLGASQTKP